MRNAFPIDQSEIPTTAPLTVEFMNLLKGNGHSRSYTDAKKPGLTVRVSAAGAVSYGLRYKDESGHWRRQYVGAFPAMAPQEARDIVDKLRETLPCRRDPPAVRVMKRAKAKVLARETNPTLTGMKLIDERYRKHLISKTKRGAQRTQELIKAFPVILTLPLIDITYELVDQWRIDATEEDDLAPATINRRVALLSGLLSRAKEWGYLSTHPLAGMGKYKEPPGRCRYFSDEEEARLYAALDARDEAARAARDRYNAFRRARHQPELPDLRAVDFIDHLRPMIDLTRQTGLRSQECRLLEWRDVNFKTRQLHVRAENCKTGEGRWIPLSTRAFDVLSKWHRQSMGTFVFPNAKGTGPLGSPRKGWRAVLKAANIDDFRWHDLRHDFASRLTMAGANLTTVGRWLGQRNQDVTDIYIHLAPNYERQTVTLLDQFNGVSSSNDETVPAAFLTH